MKNLLYLLLLFSSFSFAQPDCPEYSTVGPSTSGYITTSDPACAICPDSGAAGPWSGSSCGGTLVSTAVSPTLSMTLAYTAVNTDDFATISIDGGGIMTITGVNVGVAGAVIGPYLCGGSFGDVFITVTSTLPFTTVTLLNTGCSSGWVISCPGGDANAGEDDLDNIICESDPIFVLGDSLSLDAELSGTWIETTTSGAFDVLTTEFDPSLAGPGIYTFEYEVTGCGSPDTSFFTITVTPDVTAGADDLDNIVCYGLFVLEDSLSIDAGAGGVWTEITSSGAFDPLTSEFDATLAVPGIYTFEYEVVTCTGTDIAVFTFTVGPGGTAGEDNTASLCNSIGSNIDINTLLVGADVGGYWNEITTSGAFDAISAVFNGEGLVGGDYIFTYTFDVPDPCIDDVATFTITVNEIPNVVIVSDPSPAIICEGENITLTASGAGVGGTYIWTPAIINGINFSPSLGIASYSVIATDVFTCSNTNSISIEVQPVPTVVFSADTVIGCDPFTVIFTNETIVPGIACDWSFGDGTSAVGCGAITHTYTNEGEFDVNLHVQSTAICGADALYPTYISVIKQPIASFSYLPQPIDIEATEVEFANESIGAELYEWNFGDLTAITTVFEPIHSFPEIPNKQYDIRLIATNNIGCADTVYKPITVNDVIIFYIPNVFTPDGDDFNEVFKPVMTSGHDVYDYHLMIYNRWGEIVFESFDATYGWNGAYGDGSLVDEGTYIWRIEFGDTISDEKHEYQGHVTLLK